MDFGTTMVAISAALSGVFLAWMAYKSRLHTRPHRIGWFPLVLALLWAICEMAIYTAATGKTTGESIKGTALALLMAGALTGAFAAPWKNPRK